MNELHRRTWGSEDVCISNNPSTLSRNYIRVFHHESISLGDHAKQKVVSYVRGCALANLRIHGTSWHRFELATTAGQVLCSLPSSNYGNSFFLTDGGHFLPFVAFHQFVLQIGEGTATVEYDIVECRVPASFHAVFKSFVFVSMSVSQTHRIPLYFRNPIEKLYFVLETDVDELPNFVCKVNNEEFTLPLTKIQDAKYELNFGMQTVNFTNLQSAEIVVQSSEANHVEVCAIAYNIIRSVCDMYGLAF